MTEAAAREAFYDEHIAPVLLDLCNRCAEQGISFLSVVEWEPGEQGRTVRLQEQHGVGIDLANLAAATNGNIDGLIMYTMKKAREEGHSSICLNELGVPFSPLL